MSRLETVILDPGIDERTVKFEVGEVIVTPAASAALNANGQTLADLLARHQAGDWGEVSDRVCTFNERALVEQCNLQSAYEVGNGHQLVMITNQQWAVTMVHFDHRGEQVLSRTCTNSGKHAELAGRNEP